MHPNLEKPFSSKSASEDAWAYPLEESSRDFSYEPSIHAHTELEISRRGVRLRSREQGVVNGYAAGGKSKARLLCEAFIQGAGGGSMLQPPPNRLKPGSAVFFGVTEPTEHLWMQAQREQRDWYYLDNAYFDAARGKLFRAVRNRTQAGGNEPPDWARWAKLGIEIQPWKKNGRHILLVVQSQTHMKVVARQSPNWWKSALHTLQAHTDREIIVRGWRSNKIALASTLGEALKDCWALVTWSSAAANEAVLAGVPVFTCGSCAASGMGLSDLTQIEHPVYPEGRAVWGAALAGRQWSVEEFRDGTAWRALHA